MPRAYVTHPITPNLLSHRVEALVAGAKDAVAPNGTPPRRFIALGLLSWVG